MSPYDQLRVGRLLMHDPVIPGRYVYQVDALYEGGRMCDLTCISHGLHPYTGIPMTPGYWARNYEGLPQPHGWRILTDEEEAMWRLTGKTP